ncbi:DUF459 domain-containing protein [Aquamicrobium sp. LC103]|uniref:SGNH/GDSL hydrolase family protein n=1 Tax=Aquamicrobium sp. LC103 TaxID=1120658 RepID=UPI000B32B01E|nr:DUF459 domain-containing protein [Aquamicrobium sp. LC103]
MFGARKLAGIAVILIAVGFVLPTASPLVTTAHAQEVRRSGGGGLLRFLFRRAEPQPPPVQRQPQRVAPRRAQPQAKRQRPAAPPPVIAKPAIEKNEDAKRVLVVGDFLAGGMAEGLEAAFAENADILVVNRSSGSSGFVRDDYYNWPGEIAGMLDKEKPAAVVVMIGSNDRQQLVVAGNREQPRTDPWLKEYEARATAFAKIIDGKDVPLLWVSAIPFKSGSMTSDMLAFNDIYRRVAESVDGEFVDVWDGFADENGAFVANGPDMNGQPAQLRSGDGINITRAGRRKIAFFAEKPLNRILGGNAVPGAPSLEAAPLGAVPGEAPKEIERTQPISLGDPELDGASELLGSLVAPRNGEPRNAGERFLRKGLSLEAKPGRADDFLPHRAKPDADTAARTDPDNTGALRR